MFQVTYNGQNRLDIQVSGKFDREDVKIGLTDFIKKSDGIVNGKVFYKIDDLAMPSLGAIAVKLKQLPELFSILKRFDRMAVVSDKRWLNTVADWEGALIPGLDIKGFLPEQEAEAQAWLNENDNIQENAA
ncbi:MAG: STAS/SEC14 domain-containing protein [Pseudomonadales bacterium]|nr:STAS/SEC14 domain-containing protein [Pseudomonadales bacterium]